jgi:mRNA-degrading endonuclease RelE of RelBE toxin-antitoxin system
MKTITTPKGKARWCYLTKPASGKYDDPVHGTYRCELVLSEEDWNAYKVAIQPEYEKAYDEICRREGKQVKKTDTSPFKIDNEGNHYLDTKMKGGGIRKDTKELYKLSVALFDKDALPIKTNKPIIGAGSEIKIGIKPYFYYVPTSGFGVRLEPQAVQILKLIEPSKSEAASTHNFTAEETGYTHGGETFEQTLDQPTNDNNAEEKEATPLTADF